MTNREAINLISRNKSVFQHNPTMLEALDRAIKAFKFIEDNYPKTFEDYLKGEVL